MELTDILDDLLQNSNPDEAIAFFQGGIPIMFSEENISKIANLERIEKIEKLEKVIATEEIEEEEEAEEIEEEEEAEEIEEPVIVEEAPVVVKEEKSKKTANKAEKVKAESVKEEKVKQATTKIKTIDDLIEKGPKIFLEPECLLAADELWSKNIYALTSKIIKNDLFLILDKLSKENMEIFNKKIKEDPKKYYANLGKEKYLGIRIANYIDEEPKKVAEQLKKLVLDFEMQDIQRGYWTEKTFLMHICSCEKVEGLKEYETKNQNPQVVFDVKKMDKSFKEYLKDSEYEKFYIPREHRIYYNQFYYDAHQNYKNFKNKKDA